MVQLGNLLSWSCLLTLASVVSSKPTQQESPFISVPLYQKKSNALQRQGIDTPLFSDKSAFYAKIQVGTPPETYNVVMDTGR
jgi:hypothetical protein